MAIHDDVIYEEVKGERVLVKSEESVHTVYLRFTNRTSRTVDVWWRDFNGLKRHYIRLKPGAHYNINTYLTHPWQFTDSLTKDSLAINNNPIFRPPSHIGGMMYRTNWNICVRVHTLRKISMLTLATLLPNPGAATTLDLPIVLSEEVAQLVSILKRTPPDVRSRGQ